VAKATIGTIQRQLLVLEQQGGEAFFGEPALDMADLLRTTPDGRGLVNVLAADRLMQSPRVYATFLLWLLSELFERLPEVGDAEKPRLVFFFDEAHLLFDEAPKALVDKVEQVVKLIRSKGVGVYFVTQNPLDIPDAVLAQLGNRLQHALRAYTPREQKAVKAAASAFRPNPELNVEEAISVLGVGEALVSTLGEGGVPSPVQRTLVRPPSSRLGPIQDAERTAAIQNSPVRGKYDTSLDRESAFEMLAHRTIAAVPAEAPKAKREAAPTAEREATRPASQSGGFGLPDLGGMLGGGRRSNRQSVAEAAVKSVVRSVGSQLGRELVRGILGSLRR
jgi:DNA helicase HerA-like ATPase